ncbi:hypothetical protein CYMTET_15758 [Cymbomonas tetramitiformis]|uniref:Enoyl reductase (ER) domain-containing protein n=1 Tax=Cymbomonas tetramitiformis TaxID=36881 RepID=A0AAE0L8N4_9CHLO|nr:hypothetical protein CYMTET_15758 [Cymbomonas tetramitiformis]
MWSQVHNALRAYSSCGQPLRGLKLRGTLFVNSSRVARANQAVKHQQVARTSATCTLPVRSTSLTAADYCLQRSSTFRSDATIGAFLEVSRGIATGVAGPPSTMKAVVLTKPVQRFNDTCRECFEMQEVPVPVPEAGEILVKVARSQVNPSDSSYLKGMYGKRLEVPSRAGFEGCGTVVNGNGHLPEGARVAFRSFGAWAEYCTAPVQQCIPLPASTEWANAAGAIVNPLTAYCLVDIAKSRGAKVMVLTAAASGLGRQMIRYGKSLGIGSIAVVRRAEQARICLDEGALAALDSSDPAFALQLQVPQSDPLCSRPRIRPAAPGSMFAPQLRHMLRRARGSRRRPAQDTGASWTLLHMECHPLGCEGVEGRAGEFCRGLCTFMGVSGKPLGDLPWSHLIFQGKSVQGFWMTKHLDDLLAVDPDKVKGMLTGVGTLLQRELCTTVSRTFKLEDVADALLYMRRNMSLGKVHLLVEDDETAMHKARALAVEWRICRIRNPDARAVALGLWL